MLLCNQFNSLTTVGYLLEVFIKLLIPSMVHISLDEIILSQREKGLHKRTEPIISAPPSTGSNKNKKKQNKRKGKKKDSNHTKK